MTFKEAARKVLAEAGEPLGYREITKRALAAGYLEDVGKTPWSTMNAQLNRDIEKKGVLSDFKKIGRGKFSLNDVKEEIEEETKTDRIRREVEEEEEQQVTGGYTGRAGEYAVAAELLFRGFNTALMGVDVGADLVAIKDGKTFLIQVKTRNISESHQSFFFNIRIASYERHQSGNTFYIFLLREKGKVDYLILPYHVLERMIEQNYAHVAGNGTIYRLSVRRRDGQVYIGRRENKVTNYLNKWNVIR